jgi:hypothetical protein
MMPLTLEQIGRPIEAIPPATAPYLCSCGQVHEPGCLCFDLHPSECPVHREGRDG